jgi:hypothetical protein
MRRGLRLARAENAATYALGLLVLVLVFVALAGPAQSLRVQTQALRQQLATLSPVDKTVDVSSDWTTLTGVLNYGPDGYLFQNALESARDALARSFTTGGVPITTGAFDGLASSAYPVASGAAASAQAGTALQQRRPAPRPAGRDRDRPDRRTVRPAPGLPAATGHPGGRDHPGGHRGRADPGPRRHVLAL